MAFSILLGFKTIDSATVKDGQQLLFYHSVIGCVTKYVAYAATAIIIKTGLDHTLRGDAYAVAGAAKGAAKGRNDTYATGVTRYNIVVRCGKIRIRNFSQRWIGMPDMIQYFFVCPVECRVVTAFTVERHLFNKAHGYRVVPGQLYQWNDVFFVS